MSTTIKKINIIQLFMIMLLSNGLSTHVTVNPMVLDVSGRDSWITVLVSGLLYLPWCVLLVIFMRRSGQQKLQPWLAKHLNPFFSWLLVIPLCIQFYVLAVTTIMHSTVFTITNYLPMTPKLVLAIALVFVCWYCAQSGIRTIAIGAGILLPVVVALGYFVSFANIPHKDMSLLKPYLEHGWQPVIKGLLYTGGGLVELVMVITLQHRLKSKMKIWQLLLLGILLIYIMMGPIIGAITEFGYKEASKQLESPYEQWRLVKLGQYIEHVDFLSEFQWLSGATVRISLAQFLIGDMLPFSNHKKRNLFLLFLSLSFIVVAALPIEKYSLYLWMFHYYTPATLIVLFSLSIFFLIVSLFAKTKRGAL